MTPRVNINSRKTSVAGIKGAGGALNPSEGIQGMESLRKFLGSNKHLDWLKIDLNVAKTTTFQGYKRTKN